jgi:2-methylisocitrate lyase-like PEP mutase family enzyme
LVNILKKKRKGKTTLKDLEGAGLARVYHIPFVFKHVIQASGEALIKTWANSQD